MKKLIQIAALLWLVSTGAAQQILVNYNWQDLAQDHKLQSGEVVSLNGKSVLKIENTNDTALQLHLFTITSPPVSHTVYALTGQVKYDNVQGAGYLEMWNFFSPSPGLPEAQAFSRTLGNAGDTGKLTGTCDWRSFSLPFDRTGASGPPTRLEINIFLPGKGTVYLSPVKLVQYPKGFSFVGSTSPGDWWSPRLSAIFGGVGGSLIGCLGALIGCLAGVGKARRFVMGMAKLLTALGILLTIAGVVAVVCKQPYAIWYPLLLAGVILAAVCGANLPAIKKRYEDLEIRRMTSMDATGR